MEIPVRCRVKEQEPVTAVMSGYDRPSDCPLVEVPEHGRLIDADVIGNWLREQHVLSMPATCKIDSIIKDAPTVLEANE